MLQISARHLQGLYPFLAITVHLQRRPPILDAVIELYGFTRWPVRQLHQNLHDGRVVLSQQASPASPADQTQHLTIRGKAQQRFVQHDR
ncbi:hypothetical protein D3C80_680980 [compost metagenome]